MTVGTVARSGSTVALELKERTIRVNNQIYPLANIARIQSLTLKPPRWQYAVRVLQVAGAIAVVLLFFGSQPDSSWTTLAFVMLLIATACALIVVAAQQSKYVCALETNGAQTCVLYSPDKAEVDNLVTLLVRTIESPPREPIVGSVAFTIIGGDQISMSGSGNVGKVANS